MFYILGEELDNGKRFFLKKGPIHFWRNNKEISLGKKASVVNVGIRIASCQGMG